MDEEHKTLKFKNKFVDEVALQRFETTFRIGKGGEYNPGEMIKLVDESGYEFATAKVLWVKRTSIRGVESEDFGAHHVAATPGQLLHNLQVLYDREVSATEEIQVIKFRVMNAGRRQSEKKGGEQDG